MNYTEPADLAGPDDPDNAHVFESELDTNAEQLATPHAATMEQVEGPTVACGNWEAWV